LKVIRASEIGTFVYCQRAWHFLLLGYESENQAEMAGGSELHYRHGRAVMASGCLRTLAYTLLLVALALLAVYAVGKLG
jgi:hypothetical protein